MIAAMMGLNKKDRRRREVGAMRAQSSAGRRRWSSTRWPRRRPRPGQCWPQPGLRHLRLGPARARPLRPHDRAVRAPGRPRPHEAQDADTVFGHEFCCEVLERAGRRPFKAGDAVVSLPGADHPDRLRHHRLFQPHPRRLRRAAAALRHADAGGPQRPRRRACRAHRAPGGGRARGGHGRSAARTTCSW